MINKEEYNMDIKKLYIAKNESDIYGVLDFCDKYDGKLGLSHIPDLMKMFNDHTEASEAQNEYIATLLSNIVKKYGQEAVNIIVENTDTLLEEKSEGCMLYIVAMFLFWNADQKLDIITPLMTAKESIKELYKEEVHRKLESIKTNPGYYRTDHKELIQDVENKLTEI